MNIQIVKRQVTDICSRRSIYIVIQRFPEGTRRKISLKSQLREIVTFTGNMAHTDIRLVSSNPYGKSSETFYFHDHYINGVCINSWCVF